MESISIYLFLCRFLICQDSNIKSCTSLMNSLEMLFWLTLIEKYTLLFEIKIWNDEMTLLNTIFIHTLIPCYCLPTFRCSWLKAKKKFFHFHLKSNFSNSSKNSYFTYMQGELWVMYMKITLFQLYFSFDLPTVIRIKRKLYWA